MNEYLLDIRKLGKELDTIDKNLPERFDPLGAFLVL